jgi:hypothetical protein
MHFIFFIIALNEISFNSIITEHDLKYNQYETYTT